MIYYFGTFNPIHKGHVEIANKIKQSFNEDVCLIPAYDSPWKPNLKDNYDDRITMIKMCNLKYSDIESKLPTPSYTVQTVKEIINNSEYKNPGRLKFIIGYDQFFNIEKWKDWEYLRDNCFFIVIPREMDKIDIYSMLDKGFNFCIFGMKYINISSTEVRKGNLDLVPDTIRNYVSMSYVTEEEQKLREEYFKILENTVYKTSE